MPHIGFFRAVLHGITGEECLARILGLISRSFAGALYAIILQHGLFTLTYTNRSSLRYHRWYRLKDQCELLGRREGREHLMVQEFLKVRTWFHVLAFSQIKCFMILLSVLQVLKGRFTSKEQYHHEQLLNLAYKESKDEFEDPDNLKRSKCPNWSVINDISGEYSSTNCSLVWRTGTLGCSSKRSSSRRWRRRMSASRSA